MRLTVATLALRDALVGALAELGCTEDPTALATNLMADGHPVAQAVDRVRREAFEAGGSPAISVLLSEAQEAGPGDYQAGLARAVELMSQEMAQHYGSIFESGIRIGREQAARDARRG